MSTIEIKSIHTGNIIFTHTQDNNSIRVTLELAVKQDVNLEGADLAFANLENANLDWACLSGANLRGADLRGASLRDTETEDCNLQDIKHNLNIPLIENLHQKVAANITLDNFDMGVWHCGTTHCHAGHIVDLAGTEGYELEAETSPDLAAKLIAAKSSKIPITDDMFYLDNTEGFNNIQELARKESELKA